jgi:hypothetical protein
MYVEVLFVPLLSSTSSCISKVNFFLLDDFGVLPVLQLLAFGVFLEAFREELCARIELGLIEPNTFGDVGLDRLPRSNAVPFTKFIFLNDEEGYVRSDRIEYN